MKVKMSNKTTKDLLIASREAVRQQAPVEPHPADSDYRPPVSTVKLPSRGLVYPPESPLYMIESVDIKSVSAKEENILASPVLIRKGTVLTTLMKACITNRSIDPDTMLVGDRNAILTAIRVSAYGQRYHARAECPECHSEFDHEFDLSKLELKMLETDPVGGPGRNEFSFKLPIMKKEVRFKLFDANDVNELERNIEAVAKKTNQEQGVTLRLLAQIVSIEGVPQEKLARAIDDMPAMDSRALRSYMDDIAPGVEMMQDYDCKGCGKVTQVHVPMGSEFFWPSKI